MSKKIETIKIYGDGVLVSETAHCIEDKYGFWSYAVPIAVAVATIWQMAIASHFATNYFPLP